MTPDEARVQMSIAVASEIAACLERSGLPRTRAIGIAARSAARACRSAPSWRSEELFTPPEYVRDFRLLWTSPGGGSTCSSSFGGTSQVFYRDAKTPIGFSVPILATVPVSGGGQALQNAILAAAPGTELQIVDSLAYDPVVIGNRTNLTISVVPGQMPSITAVAGTVPMAHNAIKFDGGNSGVKISGLRLIGNGNGNGPDQRSEGIINGNAATTMASIDRIIIEDCIFSELVPTSGAPAIQFIGTDGSVHTNIQIHRCVATDCGSNPNTALAGYSTFEVSGFSSVFMQNCRISRTSALPRATSQMAGYGWKSSGVVVEDCLADDLGTGGVNTAFLHHAEAIFGTVVGNSSVRNCVAYNTARAYRITLPGATMTVTDSVVNVDVPGLANPGGNQRFVVAQISGTLIFQDSVVSMVPGEGLVYGNGTATPTHTFNDIFGGLVDPLTPLAPSELTVDPLFLSVASRVWVAEAPALQTSASDGGAMGVRYSTGEIVIWAGPT